MRQRQVQVKHMTNGKQSENRNENKAMTKIYQQINIHLMAFK